MSPSDLEEALGPFGQGVYEHIVHTVKLWVHRRLEGKTLGENC